MKSINRRQKKEVKSRESRAESRESRFKSQDSGFKSQDSRFKNEDSRFRSRDGGQNRDNVARNSQLTTHNSPLIFGILPVLEALRAGNRRIDKILIGENTHEKRLNEIMVLAKENRIPFQKVPRANLSKLVEIGANHQGVIAFTAAADYYEADKLLNEISQKIEAGEAPLIVILDGVEDPRNLGAILRSVECAGVDGVFIPERRAVGLTETAAKSSAGATEYVKVAKVTNLNRLIEDLKSRNIWVVGTSVETEKTYDKWDWKQPTALVMGSEGSGLHRLVAENCDVLVKIPMQGKIESLNVSVATGVILFEAIRQRLTNNE